MDVFGLWTYWLVIALGMTGLYVLIARENLVKKMMGLNIFQVSVIILYVSVAKESRDLGWFRGVTSADNNKILVLVDGVPWYDGIYTHAWIDEYMSLDQVRQIEVIKGYKFQSWRDDIRGCLLKSGIEQKPTTFLFVDT